MESNDKAAQSISLSEEAQVAATSIASPVLSGEILKNINDVVGLNLGGGMLSWSHIDRSFEVLEWNATPTTHFKSRMNDVELFTAVRNCIKSLPTSCSYVLEDYGNTRVDAYSQLIQRLKASMFAQLNKEYGVNSQTHKVFILKPNTVSRIHGLLVGSERVSAQPVVERMLLPESGSENTGFRIQTSMMNNYNVKEPSVKEGMASSMLVSTTFLQLVLLRSPKLLNMLRRK